MFRRLAGIALTAIAATAASLPSCDAGTAKYKPCELHFEWNAGEAPASISPFHDELLNVEFRGPDQTTFLIRAFWDGGNRLRVRFAPNQAGTWNYRVTSEIKRFEVRDKTFSVSDDASPGWVSVANLRHWWTDNKRPHLWVSAEVPWLELSQSAFQAFADGRKADGFTHLRGILLTDSNSGPLRQDGTPNFDYFSQLDDRLLYADAQGFTLDLILASEKFVSSGALDDWRTREDLVQYLVSRYACLNSSWQGLEHFENRQGNRELLKQISELLKKSDSFHRTQSTDAASTSSMLLRDGWQNYIIEESANYSLGAIEHQFTNVPQVHVLQGVEPTVFRHELWNATANAEYPVMRYASAQNPANVQAMKVWIKVMNGVRHWEFEPFFDVDGARAAGLDNVEYLLYAERPGTVEIDFSEKHKYNPRWLNPRTGEEIDLKDVKQDTTSFTTPAEGDWVLELPRDGQKEKMLKSYKFESVPPPEQVPELNAAAVPFQIVKPGDSDVKEKQPVTVQVKLTKTNRSTRLMQYMWVGEVIADGEGPRVLAFGSNGSFQIPASLIKKRPAILNLRLDAINANGKAYSLERAYPVGQ